MNSDLSEQPSQSGDKLQHIVLDFRILSLRLGRRKIILAEMYHVLGFEKKVYVYIYISAHDIYVMEPAEFVCLCFSKHMS